MAKEKVVKPGEINSVNPPLHVLHAEQRELEKRLAGPGVGNDPELIRQLELARTRNDELQKANEAAQSELEAALARIAELEAQPMVTPPAPEEKKA